MHEVLLILIPIVLISLLMVLALILLLVLVAGLLAVIVFSSSEVSEQAGPQTKRKREDHA